jgi:hypothetical protein
MFELWRVRWHEIFAIFDQRGKMNRNYKASERELVKVATFFKKQSKKLIAEKKISEDNAKVEEAVDRFIEHLEQHANTRALLADQREQLKKLVKDDAECPQCHSRDKLKFVGIDQNEKGWKSNRYKCRKCNIEFTWNRPNNPWDMVFYIEEVMRSMQEKLDNPATQPGERGQIGSVMVNMRSNLDRLKPVIDAHMQDFNQFQIREEEMEKLVHEMKNSLLIERIKMDTWENRKLS